MTAGGRGWPGAFRRGPHLVDFWELSWDGLAGFAAGSTRGWAFAPGVVLDAKVVHARTLDAVDRLEGLRAGVVACCGPAARPVMHRRAVDHHVVLTARAAQVARLAVDAELASVRAAAWSVVESVWECLALANQVVFRGRLPRVLLDTGRFDLRPPTLEDHLRTLVVATDPEALSAAAVQLAADVGTCLAALAADTPRLSADLAAAADELRDLIRQTRVDLASSQPIRAAAGLARLQTEIDTTVLGIAPGATGVTDDHHRQARAAREAAGLPDLLDGTTDPGRALTTIDARLAQMCAVT